MNVKVVIRGIEGPICGQVFEFLEHDTFLFGRSKNHCHAHLPNDILVSRHQFILEANPPDLRLRDLGSRNGTYVNGHKYGGRDVHESREAAARRSYPSIDLKNGDVIEVGNNRLQVEIVLPLFCSSCGCSIDHSDRIHAHTPSGVHCAKCRANPNSPFRVPNSLNQSSCQQCGKDVSDEIGVGRNGDYVCNDCRDDLITNPMGHLQHLMAEAAQRGGDTSPYISGYDVGQKLGQGGMGAVYLARRKNDQTNVAIKIMLSKIAVDPSSREEFLREVDITRQLNHPHIVTFLETGAIGSAFFLVMEYCPGGSLSDLMKAHPEGVDLTTCKRLMIQILRGLDFAHRANFIHRDLKPENILLGLDDHGYVAKISDFGLSKNFQKAGFSGMTATGSYAGTYPYMPREQLTNFKYVQPVSDIWSIGATFYALLSGQLPRDFTRGRDPMEIILEGKIVPIRKRKPQIPPAVAAVIDRAVANNPAERFSSAAAMHDALVQALK